MRLNFSGSGEERIREGVRRIGEAIKEQLELYGTLTGEFEAVTVEPEADAQEDPGAPRGRAAPARGPAAPRGRRVSRVAVLKGGRSLERQVSLRSGARVEDALERLGHDVVPIDVGTDLIERLRADAPEVCFVALHGRDGEDGTVQELLEILDLPYTGSGVPACSRAMDKVLTKHLLVEAGIPTPDFFAFTQTAFRELGAAETLPAIEERLDFPIVVKPSQPGLGARDQVRPRRRRRAGRAGRRVLLRRPRPAGALREGPRPRRLGARRRRGPARAAGGRGGAAGGGLLRLRGALRDRAHRVRLPGRAARGRHRAGRRAGARPPTACSACTASGGWT